MLCTRPAVNGEKRDTLSGITTSPHVVTLSGSGL